MDWGGIVSLEFMNANPAERIYFNYFSPVSSSSPQWLGDVSRTYLLINLSISFVLD